MKKLINQPQRVVEEMMQGLLAMHAGFALLPHHNVLLRVDAADVRDHQVALLSGGGSGHEPAHAGYVGAGMLSGAVAGEVFTSPTPDSIFAGVQAIAGNPGVLLIVKNYTGDRLNFGLAAEMARSQGIPVKTVIVADDIALASTEDRTGRRGIAGTVFVHKLAGAAAAEGKPLDEVAAIAQAIADDVATMGVALSAGTIPAVGEPSFLLEDDEIELGLGIHGEPGVRRVPLRSADELADELVEAIISAQRLQQHERIAVLVNNLSATTTMELAIFARRALSSLECRGLVVERVYAGSFMTSLDAAGASLSLLRVDDQRLKWLDAPTSAPAWPNAPAQRPGSVQQRILAVAQLTPTPDRDSSLQPFNKTQRAIQAACRALIDAERHLTEIDRAAGDGDLGINLARGARAIEESLPSYRLFDPRAALKATGNSFREIVGGSSGPLYAAYLMRAANSLPAQNMHGPKAWAKASLDGCDAIRELGGAEVGDRTMLDALVPFAKTLATALDQGRSTADALDAAVCAAEMAALETAGMTPRRGRSSYVGERAIGHPDAGAIAVAIWLRGIADVFASP